MQSLDHYFLFVQREKKTRMKRMRRKKMKKMKTRRKMKKRKMQTPWMKAWVVTLSCVGSLSLASHPRTLT